MVELLTFQFTGSAMSRTTFISLPGHHVDGGSLADILLVRNATRWLRFYRSYPRLQTILRIAYSAQAHGLDVAFGLADDVERDGQMRHSAKTAHFKISRSRH